LDAEKLFLKIEPFQKQFSKKKLVYRKKWFRKGPYAKTHTPAVRCDT